MAAEILQVTPAPGPCDPLLGCPPPTELVCIRTTKVYDFCFEQDIGLQNCVNIPLTCSLTITPTPPPTGSTASCAITSVTCTAGTPMPIPGQDGFSTVAKTVVVNYTVTILNPDSTLYCTFSATFTFARTVVVCGPIGTTADCDAFATCGPCIILPPSGLITLGQVCCNFNLCTLLEAHADVKLLIPAYGFCAPALCRSGGFPPFPCPPPFLFPPQCTPFGG
jgi:hypothetical protein